MNEEDRKKALDGLENTIKGYLKEPSIQYALKHQDEQVLDKAIERFKNAMGFRRAPHIRQAILEDASFDSVIKNAMKIEFEKDK